MSSPQQGARKGAPSQQRGGFALGLIVGLLIGVGLSLAVALYVTKVPVPFVDKVPQRTAEQDAAEARKNENWNPNAALSGKPATGANGNGAPAQAPAPAPAQPQVIAPPPVVAPASSSGAATPAPVAPPVAVIGTPRPAAGTTAPSAGKGADPLEYVVQIASYSRAAEAEQQRTKLILAGLTDVKVVEFEQGGGKMYRVRLGPFKVREDADRAKDQAASAGFSDASVWRANR
ncbi:SPOR domain-containing protein [Leptothrix discophora]|uniref:SPOR domain-containing protein n=1 Tax=Leptothrix discophora TaxID=89 RepID=A0ABT9G5R7_LEPDI|nr:SPOR domain-containing protein [Leptothrix discophora]MDP4301804.1 SPOR domain-containing protein [Leptothrix discophora]